MRCYVTRRGNSPYDVLKSRCMVLFTVFPFDFGAFGLHRSIRSPGLEFGRTKEQKCRGAQNTNSRSDVIEVAPGSYGILQESSQGGLGVTHDIETIGLRASKYMSITGSGRLGR